MVYRAILLANLDVGTLNDRVFGNKKIGRKFRALDLFSGLGSVSRLYFELKVLLFT